MRGRSGAWQALGQVRVILEARKNARPTWRGVQDLVALLQAIPGRVGAERRPRFIVLHAYPATLFRSPRGRLRKPFHDHCHVLPLSNMESKPRCNSTAVCGTVEVPFKISGETDNATGHRDRWPSVSDPDRWIQSHADQVLPSTCTGPRCD